MYRQIAFVIPQQQNPSEISPYTFNGCDNLSLLKNERALEKNQPLRFLCLVNAVYMNNFIIKTKKQVILKKQIHLEEQE